MGFNNDQARRVVLDLETVGGTDIGDFLDPVEAPSTYKDPVKIADYIERKQRELVERAGLEPDLCEIVAVGTQLEGDESVSAATRADGNEADLIARAWDAISDRTVVGFNCLAFDLPVLIRRSQLLGVSYPSLSVDRYRSPHLDLMQRLSFNGAIKFRSLSFYCKRFGIAIADPVDGGDVASLVAAGDWEAVLGHVQADVLKTAALAARLGLIRVPVVPEEMAL